MFVEPIEVPVCKPCPKCGMPGIKQYQWNGVTRFSITCHDRCKYIGNECTNLADAIVAWNILIEGQEKPPLTINSLYHVVQYDKQVKSIKKFASASCIPMYMMNTLDKHTQQQVLQDGIRHCYHNIADDLYENGIGETKTYTDSILDKLLLRVSLQVVDDR